ncbi:MAG TPA: PAS domain S-box protein [Draconibacterium sp.]|nr:PAS domain S-box protein [Draconibacterium sp.]
MDTNVNNINPATNATTLRLRAEELLKKRYTKSGAKLSEVETQKLIHELQVHQIELELQNKELRRTKKHAEEEQIEMSEDSIGLLYGNAKIGFYRTTPGGTIILANNALVALLGYSSFDELAKRNLDQDGFESPDKRKSFLEKIEQTGEIENFESTWIRKDRSPVLVRESTRAIRDTNGKTLFYDGIVEDITKRKRADEAVRESEENFRSMFENNSAAMILAEPDTTVSMVNDEFCRLSGYSKQEVIGTSWTAHIPPEDLERLKEYNRRRLINANDVPDKYEFTIYNKNGEIRYALMSVTLLRNRKTLASFVDITERKRTEQSLLRINKAVEGSGEAICMSDPNGRHFYHNKAFTKIFEYTVEEIQAAGGGTVIYVNKDVGRKVFDKIMGGGAWNGEVKMFSKSGRKFTVLLRADSIKDENGIIVGLVGIHTDITERKRTEESLRFFRMMIDKSQDAIEVIDVETARFIDVNEKACTDLGYSRSELLNMSVFDIDSNINMPDFQILMNDVRQSNSKMLESLHRRKNGSVFPVEINIAVVMLEKTYAIAIIRDITEKKRIENKLKKSEEQLKEAQFVGHIGSWELDLVENKGTMSDEMYKIFDINANTTEVTIETFLETPVPEDRKMVQELVMKSLKTHKGIDFDFRTITSNGEIRWIHERSNMEVDEKGNPQRVFGTCQDITERKLVELQLKESEEKYRLLAEASPEMIYLIDTKGYVTYVNRVAAAQFHTPVRELIGKHLTDIFPPDLARQNLANIQEVIATKSIFQNEVEIVFPTGSRWVDARLAPVLDENNHVIGVLGLSYDITERIQADGEIRLKNEQLLKLNAEKDKFFSIIAHDLRGPLGGLMRLTEVMADDSHDLTPDIKKELTLDLSHSARNIFNLLENLLEWSQMRSGYTEVRPQMLRLKKVLNESLKAVNDSAKNKAIEIVVEIAEKQKIFADINMLQSVIRNLVSNAIKFTTEGGKVTISANPEGDNSVEITIKDTGIGMSSEMLDSLFRLDAKNNRPGTEDEPSTGLGLVLCKEIIEKHGGRIWVRSKVGIGSSFSFSLPLSIKN